MQSDPQISTFANLVYDFTRLVPKGKVTTYKMIANALGKPGASWAVGTALSKNPFPYPSNQYPKYVKVPCHRVIASDGSIGGFFGDKNINSDKVKNKLRMLNNEGIKFNGNILPLSKHYRGNIIMTDTELIDLMQN